MADQPEQSSPVLQQLLLSLSQSADQPESSVSDLIDFLASISAQSDPDNQNSEATAFKTLTQLHHFISSQSDQAIFDQLQFELPKAVSEFGGVSERCLEVVESIIDRFISMCGARDMLAVLGEALDSLNKKGGDYGYVVPLLSGFSKVFLSLQRRHFEQVRQATRIIFKVLKGVSSELEDEAELQKMFDRAVGIADSIHAVCMKLEGGVHEKLSALLGLYVLEIVALVSMNFEASSSQAFVLQLSSFFPYCGFSYLGLITGSDVDKISRIVIGDDKDLYVDSFVDVKCGASVSVIWGHASNEVATAAHEDLTAVKNELQNNQTKRWQAFGMLKHILASVTLPWELKKHAIDFLHSIRGGNISPCDEHSDFSADMPGLFAALQAIQMVIMYTADTELRKNAFDAFKWILADIPTCHRFDILKALITKSDSSSMIAILFDIVKGEMHKESCEKMGNGRALREEHNAHPRSSLWTASILELVEFILRPPKGGPPSFPEQTDSVLSALNLYRYVLIAESRGKTNYTGVLSRSNLQKAYNEWLLPLRTLVTVIVAKNKNESDELTVDTLCTFNPVELVLYRCIELVEEKLKEST
ncbi:PREDICTED: aberrant root formation protein 4 isoform X2 [Fragaria vesca subsp. vesca]|uniref:aberrant root formation protein 4 isoform X2 n=1 Tax=Fragaria vesca subsp. vesca TaxID=101020 RepID=UPI0002C373A5|nr:PREDICTED: aberrant root formation protein 4 isoform X2 [Fragaria vesca subsp. vesca]